MKKLLHILHLHTKCRPSECPAMARRCNRLIYQQIANDYRSAREDR